VPIYISCPSCKQGFNAPDSSAGKRARCPKCGGAIDIAGTPAAVMRDVSAAGPTSIPRGDSSQEFDDMGTPADDLDVVQNATSQPAADRKPCPMCGEMILKTAAKCRYCGEVFDPAMRGVLGGAGDASDPGWRRVRSGLATVYNSIVIMFGTLVLMGAIAAVCSALGMFPEEGDPPVPFLIAMGIGAFIIIGAAIAIFVGQFMCAAVPERSGARGFALGAAICFIVNFLLNLVGGSIDSDGLSSFGSLFNLAGCVLSILFIRASAKYLNNQELASSAAKYLIFGVVMFVLMFIAGVAAGVGMAAGGGGGAAIVFGVLGIAAIVALLVAIIWYLRLISSLMKTIDARM